MMRALFRETDSRVCLSIFNPSTGILDDNSETIGSLSFVMADRPRNSSGSPRQGLCPRHGGRDRARRTRDRTRPRARRENLETKALLAELQRETIVLQ